MSAVRGARTCVRVVRSTAECRCLFSRTDMQLRHVRVRCMRFLAYFHRFRCLNVTTLFHIEVKIRFRAVATAAALLPFCALLWTCLLFNMCSRYFSLHFLVYTVEFQRVNSRLCVAMMVFAPIYVAQMISSYLRDPENKTGALIITLNVVAMFFAVF